MGKTVHEDRIRKKSASERRAKILTYILLISGSILILIPFYWMVGSSLKEPAMIFKSPPEWLPTQQVMMKINGADCGLATLKIGGKDVKVAEIVKTPEGDATVQVLPGQPDAGKKVDIRRTELTEIRKVAPKGQNYVDALRGGVVVPPGDRGLFATMDEWRKQSRARAEGLAVDPSVSQETKWQCAKDWMMGHWPFALYLINTCTITFIGMLGQMASASIVAYGFARMRFPLRDFWFIVLLSTIMLPPQVTLIPVFKIFTSLGWYDSFYPLTVPAFFGGGVFFIFLLRQYYMTIPIEMDEAAKIDGAGALGIFLRVILPQAKPVLATVAIFSFMAHWNDFLGPLIYLGEPTKRTLALALWSFQGEHATDWHLLMAAATVVMSPLLIIFFCAQKYFIQGVVISGVKG